MSKQLRALIVEDSDQDAELLLSELKRNGYDLAYERVQSADAMRDALAHGPWDVVLSDYRLPHFNAPAALELVRATGQDLPFIIVSGTIGEDTAVKALKAGANDFLVKGHLGRLTSAIERERRDVIVRRERQQLEDQLRQAQTMEAIALRASEARYRALFDQAPDGILICQPDTIYIDANPSICQMLGYSRDELLGMRAIDIVASHEVQHIAPALQIIASRSDYHREWQFKRRDGSVFVADVIAAEMPDGNVLAVIRDVTERNRAIDALAAAEERMRFALESAGVGIWDMNYLTGRLQWSTTLETQHGLAPGTFAGTFEAFVERVYPDDRQTLTETVGKAMRSGDDFTTEHRALWPDGTVRWLDGAGRVLLNDRGEAVRGVGICQDVTERRTLELQYQQAQKMEAVGQLAGGIAHDFNNLLTAVLGFSGFVRDSLDADDSRRADVDQIIHAGERAAALTKQLLAFSRKEVSHPVRTNVNEVVTNTHKMLRRLIGEHIEVELTLDPGLAFVHADPGQLDQILLNLAVNARDAMPNGGRLTIETANVHLDQKFSATHREVVPGPYVMLAVSDSGIGMTEDIRRRLFEPFFTTKEPGKGTGLGLATVFGIVKQSAGHIYVYSEPGHGATFKVYFPRLDADVQTTPTTEDTPSPRGSENVLLVEDEQAVRVLVRTILEHAGYHVRDAPNPQQAEAVFDAEKIMFDALVTDVVMPGGTGPALWASLRMKHPRLRVLYMSGYTDDAMFRTGRLEPGAAFLQKPFAADAILRKLRDVLDTRLEEPA